MNSVVEMLRTIQRNPALDFMMRARASWLADRIGGRLDRSPLGSLFDWLGGLDS